MFFFLTKMLLYIKKTYFLFIFIFSLLYNKEKDVKLMINRLKDLDNFYLLPKSYYHQTFDDSFNMDIHAHQYIELMYCQNGSCSIIISKRIKDSFQEIEIKLSKKNFILIDAGAYHKLKINKNESCTLYNIEWDVDRKSVV